MSELAIAVWVIAGLYVGACVVLGGGQHLPIAFRLPYLAWDVIAHSWRRPRPVQARPNYAQIERLERELGLGETHPTNDKEN
ncbi:hypothetical protein OIU91_05800 [Streptomyces sp. NBC_01456]|uniref:hypothetical protein n=1 Tax=unclassified Streptomyces TaxID=2593676 RepID=UPI002E33627E|nr:MULTISPECIES: hypothetical protein [unclassified Streptomyces]